MRSSIQIARRHPCITSSILRKPLRRLSSAPSTSWAWRNPSARGSLHGSTSEIYGDPTMHPQTEDYRGNVNTLGPRACYDEGKRCAETLCFDYYRQHKVGIKVVAFSNL